jgi:guanine deaminase
MAHGVHLSDTEVALLADRGTAVAHCPLSNAYFAHGVLRVRELWAAGVKIGLGTDVAGGYAPSMLSAIRSAVVSSRMLEEGVDRYDYSTAECSASVDPAEGGKGAGMKPKARPGATLSLKESLYLATQGGAEALALGEEVGTLEVGKKFDAIQVVIDSPGSIIDVFQGISTLLFTLL